MLATLSQRSCSVLAYRIVMTAAASHRGIVCNELLQTYASLTYTGRELSAHGRSQPPQGSQLYSTSKESEGASRKTPDKISDTTLEPESRQGE
jgi:hypothetical protein